MCAAAARPSLFRPCVQINRSFCTNRIPSAVEQETTISALQKLSTHSLQINVFQAFNTFSFSGKYTLIQVIGKGSFGVVIKARDPNGLDVAIKISRYDQDEHLSSKEHLAFQRLNKLTPNQTPRVIEFAEHLDLNCGNKAPCCQNRSALVTTYGGATVHSYYIDSSKIVPADEFIKFMHQCISFWQCLHANNLVLRDIKPTNMLIDDQKQIRFIDFSACAETGTESYWHESTTRYYRSPSVLTQALHAAEMPFTLACVFFEVLTGSYLFYTKLGSTPSHGDDVTPCMLKHLSTVFELIPPSQEWIKSLGKDISERFFQKTEAGFLELKSSFQSSDSSHLSKKRRVSHDPIAAGRHARMDDFQQLIKAACDPKSNMHRVDLGEIDHETFHTQVAALLLQLLNYEHPPTPEQVLAHPFFKKFFVS